MARSLFSFTGRMREKKSFETAVIRKKEDRVPRPVPKLGPLEIADKSAA